MTDCPHCLRPIEISEINHGTLFTCPLCNAVYFVGWDGQPELPPTAEDMALEDQLAPDDPDATRMAFAPIENSTQETIIDNSAYQAQEYDSLDVAAAEAAQAALAAEEPIDEESYDFSQPLDRIPEAPMISDSSNFQDINDFANSNKETSALTYTLMIQGIDTKKIYGELRDALTDSRLGWDAMSLMKTIRNGSLSIRGLNPAKTFVIVSRIKYLSVQVSWRQDVLAAP